MCIRDRALANQAHDPADIISLLDLDKIEVDAAGTLKTDLDGLLKPLKESKALSLIHISVKNRGKTDEEE